MLHVVRFGKVMNSVNLQYNVSDNLMKVCLISGGYYLICMFLRSRLKGMHFLLMEESV